MTLNPNENISFLSACARRVVAPPLHPVLDTLLSNGKHVRPWLGVRLCNVLGVDPAPLHDAFTAIELIHASSLVHDDIVDEDALRRGLPAMHARFGTHAGLLFGDYFFISALQLVAQKKYSPRLVEHVVHAVKAMTHAQIRETLGQVDTLEKYWEYVHGKTGALMRLCATLPLEQHGLTHGSLEDFALAYGVAFQVADDLSESSEKNELSLPGFIGREASVETFSKLREELDAFGIIPSRELPFISFEKKLEGKVIPFTPE